MHKFYADKYFYESTSAVSSCNIYKFKLKLGVDPILDEHYINAPIYVRLI